jgi:hypothetical protein
MTDIIETLLASSEPSIRYKTRVHLLGESPTSAPVIELREEIRRSDRVRRLLSERGPDGTIPRHSYYRKWYGTHWTLVALADLDYPPGDPDLVPLREQLLEWLFSDEQVKRIKQVTIAGRVRMCASIEGNAINALLMLGLADERVDLLVQRLLAWQWPDGGWNCDKNPEAKVSSFTETLIPLRGLARYGRETGDLAAIAAAERAAEVFLERALFRRKSDHRVISADFLDLHYPCYWHYDILVALKVLGEAGFLGDPRCAEAIAFLEAKRLSDGGFPAERKYYQVTSELVNGRSLVDWGGTSRKQSNPFVTVEALMVLKQMRANGDTLENGEA